MTYLITGGAGFIGSHLVDEILDKGQRVLVLDLLTYAGSLDNLKDARRREGYAFVQGDISDSETVSRLLREFDIRRVIHVAAESHVDNSIIGPAAFIQTNIVGTYILLDAARAYWEECGLGDAFRFIHVSTDEVYGDLSEDAPPFNETSTYAPNSPYAASKASSDHLARAWCRTYGLPVIITNCSNNFGPRQHREKLIPTIVRAALTGERLPVYGDGSNIRDWLYARDHVKGLFAAAERGEPGESYCFGGGNEVTNLDLIRLICRILDAERPLADGKHYAEQISFVTDRHGHDRRYAVNSSKAEAELGFTNSMNFENALHATIMSLVDLFEADEKEEVA